MSLRPPLRSVTDTLEAEGLFDDAARCRLLATAPVWAARSPTPWTLQVLMFVAAWIAAPCIAAGPLSWIGDAGGALWCGLLGAGLTALLRHRLRHVFSRHILLAFSLTFQAMFAYGVGDTLDRPLPMLWASAGLAAVLFFAHPDSAHRACMSTVTAFCAGAALAVDEISAGAEVVTVLALLWAGALSGRTRPPVLGRYGTLARPAARGLLLAGLFGAWAASPVVTWGSWWEPHWARQYPLVVAIPAGVGLALVVLRVLTDCGVPWHSPPALAAAAAALGVAALSGSYPVLPAALGALLLGFRSRDPSVVALGTLAAAWGVVAQWTRVPFEGLPHGIGVVAAGLVLLLAWWCLARTTPDRRGGTT